jgi:hypothetical protein
MAFLFGFLLEVVFAFGPMTLLLLFGIAVVAWQRWSPNHRLRLTGDACER